MDNIVKQAGKVDGLQDATMGKGCDAVSAFNRAMQLNRYLTEANRNDYALAYNLSYRAEYGR